MKCTCNNVRYGLFPALVLWASYALAGPNNIATLAKATASSEFSAVYRADGVNDGVIGLHKQGEWACKGQTSFWGYIRYPWIKLVWEQPQTINKVVLYDRPALEEHTAGGILSFSDGTEIRVNALPNDGSPERVHFPAKTVSWIKFDVFDGVGKNLGLSEMEVFPAPESYTSLVDWVDPTIETTRGRWFFCAPGSRPFGMISAAPYTRNKNQWGGGYNYNSTEILGFSQIHNWIMSGLNLMPTTGGVDPAQGEQGWKSSFSHDSEIIRPGYQRVFLSDYNTWVEMTTTDRVGLYRYTFTKENTADILLALGGWIGGVRMVDADVQKVSDTRIEGSIGTTGRLWGGPQLTKVFFVLETDQPFRQMDGWKGDQQYRDIDSLRAPLRKEQLRFDHDYLFKTPQEDLAGVSMAYDMEPGDVLQVKIAISYTSIENASNNLETELPHWNFDQVAADAETEWNTWLSRITVAGGTHAQQTKFYTDLWHTLLGRHKLDDVSGDYPVYMDKKPNNRSRAKLQVKTVRKDAQGKPVHHMYNSDAFWLTMWNLNVLWGLGWPEMLDEFAASLVQYADNGGLLPRGPSAGGYTFIMRGNPATSLITSAYQKGILTKIDTEHAYDTMKRNHDFGGMMSYGDAHSLRHYIDKGWAPDRAGETVQWAFEDWALGQMAARLGKSEDAAYFQKRSEGWKNLYNEKVGLLLPRKEDGSWSHKNPLSGAGWIEANAWQATWSVSHDIPGLVELMGDSDTFCKRLNHAFERSVKDDFVFGYGSGYVSYANQLGCFNAHVFNRAGKPWLSQYWVRRVNEQAYGGTNPDQGYGGHDEDQGQMGGVSALMSLGLFSLRGTCASEPVYEITSPVFDEITIRLDPEYYPGKTFVIKTHNNSKENCYIQKARLNGQALDHYWITHKAFAKGGLLELWLGPEPNKDWGVE